MEQFGSFVRVYDFMVSELRLAKYELLIYALIFSYWQQGLPFNGSRRYLCNRFNIKSEKTVGGCLKNLVEWNLIHKKQISIPQGTGCEYTINTDVLHNVVLEEG